MADPQGLQPSYDLSWTLLVLFLSVLGVVVYRLGLSSLAAVPGPKLAALTSYYELYYDIFKNASFPWKLAQLHDAYGPIVRIGPNEVHIHDPDFTNAHLSAPNNVKKNKHSRDSTEFGTPRTIHSTVRADVHRIRRKPVAAFFSKKEVATREGIVRERVGAACACLDRIKGTGQPLDLRLLFFLLANDILSDYAYPESINFLGQRELVPAWRDAVISGLRKFHYFKHFPWLWKIVHSIPKSHVVKKFPHLKLRFDWNDSNLDLVRKSRELRVHKKPPESKITVFNAIFDSHLPEPELEFERVAEEASALLGAGTETVSNILSTIFGHLLSNPDQLVRLKAELAEAESHAACPLLFDDLEKLPYLSAVVYEGLRIGYGVLARFIRVCPEEDINYKQWKLPRGTAISMSSMLQHRNPELFPNPDHFCPERWLDGEADKSQLMTFSKGSRQCLGIHLAHMELYTAVAMVITRCELQLFRTTVADFTPAFDGFQPLPDVRSKGVRVTVL